FSYLFSDHPEPAVAIVSVSALVIVFAIWWVYFCEAEHLPRRAMKTALVWGYGHVFVFMATAALGAAISASIDVATHHAHASQSDVSRWLGASLSLGAIGLWVIRDQFLPLSTGRRIALPIMALVFAGAGLLGLPVAAFAGLALVMVVWRAPETGNTPTGPA
ncbi:MAG: low temperature requirement protein A, partial [Rhodobacteraceae bacterium]|nr:low temperature requirement protein A [Paracoccaceae bacterium]